MTPRRLPARLLRRRLRRRSRGVALLLVLVVLLLVATLATEIALTARTHYQLSTHSMNDFLLRSVVEGRRQILLQSLRYDWSADQGALDKEDDPWSWWYLKEHSILSSWGETDTSSASSTPLEEGEGTAPSATRQVYRNRDVKLLGWCEDERGKLNLRGLLWEEDSPTFIQHKAALIRLIDRYREKWPELDLSDSDASTMVDELVEWLKDKEDSDENPLPPTHARQGRLLALEELLRVPGGKWRSELLYDVRDPEQSEESDFSRRISAPDPDANDADGPADDAGFGWTNGSGTVPGLFRYLTVWSEGTAGTAPKINVNTASLVVLESLFEPGDEDLAKAILDQRRQGAGSDEQTSSTTGGSTDAGATWFKAKADLAKVEGMGDDLARYPRLDTLADVKSSVYSLRIVATIVAGQQEGDEETGTESKDITAQYQYREIIQRTQQGYQSLHAERRNDPILGSGEE